MSKKHQKKEKSIIKEDAGFIDKQDLNEYFRNFFKRYCGYNFISIDPSQASHLSCIKIHKTIPVMTDPNPTTYVSPSMQLIKVVHIEDEHFEGMIVDRNGMCAFGNPLMPMKEVVEKVPDIGKNPDNTKIEYESDTI